jgi:hypothetical protein
MLRASEYWDEEWLKYTGSIQDKNVWILDAEDVIRVKNPWTTVCVSVKSRKTLCFPSSQFMSMEGWRRLPISNGITPVPRE